jgi:hypothetical protein
MFKLISIEIRKIVFGAIQLESDITAYGVYSTVNFNTSPKMHGRYV